MAMAHRPISMPPLARDYSNLSGSITGRRKSSRGIVPPGSVLAMNKKKNVESTSELDTTCSVEHLLRNSDFATRHEAYRGTDAVLGNILCLVSLLNTRFHAIIFSTAGPLVLFQHDLQDTLYNDIQAPNLHSADIARVLAITTHLHLQKIPLDILSVLESNAVTDCQTTEQHVITIVASFRLVKDISIPASLIHFLTTKYPRTVDIDLIVDMDSRLTEILPRAVEVQDKHAELHKVPLVPLVENTTKRDNLIHEILATERTYVGRLQHLVRDYAQPLRAASRKQKGILGTYETNSLFPTALDAILLLNEDLLKSLDSASDPVIFALTLAKGFQDFRKVYSRYLESSTELDQVLRAALKLPKFREFVDQTRSLANANIGIRELVMEPISRIPRYSLLISSILAVIRPDNAAYKIFREALLTVRLIGFMSKDEAEANREVLMKLAALVSSWPPELVRSSVNVVCTVDCMDLSSISQETNTDIPSQGHLCTLILCSDRLIILKRAKNSRLEEVLATGKRGELGYRGYILLEDVVLTSGDNGLSLLLLKEMSGVTSAKWINRPFRKLALTNNADVNRLLRNFETCRANLKSCSPASYIEPFSDLQCRYHVYTQDGWNRETDARKSMIRIWEGPDDGNKSYCNMSVVVKDPASFSCSSRSQSHFEMVCHEVTSIQIFKEALLEKVLSLHKTSWLNPSAYAAETIMGINQAFISSLCDLTTLNRPRPVSPSKIVASFLGRRTGETTTARLGTSITPDSPEKSSPRHTITKKKSNPLFNFGNDNKCIDGIDTFVEALLKFDHFPSPDLSPTNAQETKQASVLATNIAKDPKKRFAILGSPTKIALHALKLYCRNILSKKVAGASILTDVMCSDLRAHLKYEHDVKLARMRSVLKNAPRVNLGLLKSILTFAVHLLAAAPVDAKIPALLLVSEMIVPPLCVTSFISTLEVLIENFEAFFIGNNNTVATMESKTSCMTLPNASSQFGSISSMSQIYSTYETGSSNPSQSPAKQSYYSLTPDLIFDTNSPDGPSSLFRSPSGSSATTSLDPEPLYKYKRATIHIDKPSRHFESNGLRVSSAELPSTFAFEESELNPPRADFGLPRSQSDQVTYTLSGGAKPVLELITSPSPLLPPDTPGLLSEAVYKPTRDQKTQSATTAPLQQRRASRIPVASPKLGSSAQSSPKFAQETPFLEIEPVLLSRKEKNTPRKPSVLAARRDTRQMSRTSEYNFDDASAADYCSIMQFHDTLADPSDAESDADTKEIVLKKTTGTDMTNAEHDRAILRREITAQSGISSTATVRRVSRQLQRTSIGPLDALPAKEDPVTRWQAASSPTPSSRPGCTTECQETIELLRLELDHYKAIYRASVEEVDVTLDLANEQIEELQHALEVGSLEASAMKMLELEKEQNRKLRLELALLAEKH